MTVAWIDAQPNISADQPCDMVATVRGETVRVMYDMPGGAWFVSCEHHPRFSWASFTTRNEAQTAAETMH